jgi:hypothetical protein
VRLLERRRAACGHSWHGCWQTGGHRSGPEKVALLRCGMCTRQALDMSGMRNKHLVLAVGGLLALLERAHEAVPRLRPLLYLWVLHLRQERW